VTRRGGMSDEKKPEIRNRKSEARIQEIGDRGQSAVVGYQWVGGGEKQSP